MDLLQSVFLAWLLDDILEGIPEGVFPSLDEPSPFRHKLRSSLASARREEKEAL